MAIPKVPQVTALSYKLFVKAQDSSMLALGQVTTLSPTESRDVTPNFVIGNDPRDQASNLIPGVVRNRTIRLDRVRLYSKSLKQAFGRDDQSVVASLTDQSTPVTLIAALEDPNNGKHKSISFNDGFISDVSGQLRMEGDIREIESATFVYLSVTETEWQ